MCCMKSCMDPRTNMHLTLLGWSIPLASSFARMGFYPPLVFLPSLFLYCDFYDWIPLYPLVSIDGTDVIIGLIFYFHSASLSAITLLLFPVAMSWFPVICALICQLYSTNMAWIFIYVSSTTLLLIFQEDGADLSLCILHNYAVCIPL